MRYEIKGGMMPVVEIVLEAGESVNCEKGAMVWMSPNMQMQTSGWRSRQDVHQGHIR